MSEFTIEDANVEAAELKAFREGHLGGVSADDLDTQYAADLEEQYNSRKEPVMTYTDLTYAQLRARIDAFGHDLNLSSDEHQRMFLDTVVPYSYFADRETEGWFHDGEGTETIKLMYEMYCKLAGPATYAKFIINGSYDDLIKS